MKKGLFLQLLTCLLAVSCSVSELDTKAPASFGDDVFYASLESYSEPNTRVFVNEKVIILWDEMDQISIFDKSTKNQQYEFTGETGDNAGAFDWVADPSEPGTDLSYIYSVYPYNSSTTIDKEGVMTLTLPEEQAYRAGSFGVGANTMVSVTEDRLLKFKNVGGYLVLKFYGEGVSVSSIKLEGHQGEKLSGEATVTAVIGRDPEISMASTAGTSITLKCEEPVELGATKDDAVMFWMVVPPTAFTQGLKLTVTDPYGREFVKDSPANPSIARNGVLRISPIEVTIDDSSPSYTKVSSITVGGTYLIVDAGDEKVFKGATDGSFLNVSPWNDVIIDTDGTLAGCEFTVENAGNDYFLKYNDGRYLVCSYSGNSTGLSYVASRSNVTYPFALSTGNDGAFFFSTTQVSNTSETNQVLYFKTADGANFFKIGGSGRKIGVHLYKKDGRMDRELDFNPKSVICTLGETPEKPVLSGIYTTATYSSSDESVAMVDADGNVTPVASGTVTITATVAEDDEYYAGSASYTLRIKEVKTTDQYVRVTSANQIDLDGEYVLVYDDGTTRKVFNPVLNAGKDAFSTAADNAVDVIIDDDEIEASEVDGCRIQLANQDGSAKKFSLVVPEADGTSDYYFIVYRNATNGGASTVFFASPTETEYRSTFSLSSEGVLTLTGSNNYKFRYSSSGCFTAGTGSSANLYLFVRTGGPVKQRQNLYFAEETVNWNLGEDYEIGRSYDYPQLVSGAWTPVTYSAGPESVATIEGGKIKITGYGAATITATAEKSDGYYAATASYTLRIVKAAPTDWVDMGSFNLENDALHDYLNDALDHYTDNNDDTYTVMGHYSGLSYPDIERKDCPAPVTIRWTNSASRSTLVSIYKDEGLTRMVWEQNASEGATSAEVYNLIPGLKYYYTISEDSSVWEKGYFTTTGRRRMIKVSDIEAKGRANNCRDLGGLAVKDDGEAKTIKYGILFRGSCMDRTSVTEKSLIVDFLHVGLDLDLRSGKASSPGNTEDGNSVCYQPFDSSYGVDYVNPGFNSFKDLTTTDKVNKVITAIFEKVKKGEAVYFHCHVGADRTGYFAMMIEGLLGVSERDCTIDYELTSFSDAVGQRFRTGDPTDYYFRQGIGFLRGQPGETFQDKIEYYLVNTVKISPEDIEEFRGNVLQ